MPTVRLIIGDVRDTLTRLETDDERFDLLVTSPPFLALRSYLPADHPDKHREIGSEPTPALFLDTLYGLTEQWGRLIPEWGSICVELGDTMSGSGGAGGDYNTNGLRDGQPRFRQMGGRGNGYSGHKPDTKHGDAATMTTPFTGGPGWPLAKSMCILPHAYTLGLAYGINPLTGTPHQAGQWRIRNVITWARPNPPVGSLGKRNPHKRTGDYKFRPACSYITVACRGTGRYFDLDAVRHAPLNGETPGGPGGSNTGYRGITEGGKRTPIVSDPAGAPPLDWHTDQLDGDWLWKLATAPYAGSHYATFPLTLPRRLVLAMCPEWVCDGCGQALEYVHDERSTTRYLLGMRQGVSAGSAGQNTKDVRCCLPGEVCGSHAPDDEGLRDVRQGTQALVSTGSPNGEQGRVCDGASTGDGGTSRTDADEGRSRAPHQRREGRQPSREPGSYDSGRPQPTHQGDHEANGGVPALRREVPDEWACIHCGGTARRVGRVLDCFGGSGTTAVAAALEGRDCTLIDLDPRNVELVDRRLREALRVTDCERDGDTVTWTVEAPLPDQRQQVDGQLTLLEGG